MAHEREREDSGGMVSQTMIFPMVPVSLCISVFVRHMIGLG